MSTNAKLRMLKDALFYIRFDESVSAGDQRALMVVAEKDVRNGAFTPNTLKGLAVARIILEVAAR